MYTNRQHRLYNDERRLVFLFSICLILTLYKWFADNKFICTGLKIRFGFVFLMSYHAASFFLWVCLVFDWVSYWCWSGFVFQFFSMQGGGSSFALGLVYFHILMGFWVVILDMNHQSQLSIWFIFCISVLFNSILTKANLRQNWERQPKKKIYLDDEILSCFSWR